MTTERALLYADNGSLVSLIGDTRDCHIVCVHAYIKLKLPFTCPHNYPVNLKSARTIGGGAGGGRAGRGGTCPPLADKGGKQCQMPSPFRRLSAMMPASTEKHRHNI